MVIRKAADLDENFMRIIRDNIVPGNVAAEKPGQKHQQPGSQDDR